MGAGQGGGCTVRMGWRGSSLTRRVCLCLCLDEGDGSKRASAVYAGQVWDVLPPCGVRYGMVQRGACRLHIANAGRCRYHAAGWTNACDSGDQCLDSATGL
ncbi:hypothetical protein BDZ85DRAFT_58106 [Elsinoe ampelina]|uniref:Uncharacterized protein n=1 Tax=Elsinoe ampelina TaxID=302913 RepID=A0A6A6GNY3_9PEZI|nr:hypothetical protein BDZ85DRAFT_58106 [Elsinoe ampelina]